MVDDSITLEALANGIIPADERDAGAAAVGAGRRLAKRLAGSAIYADGVAVARDLARSGFGREVHQLTPEEIQDLLVGLRERAPAFFKQLRMDVSAMYLADAGVARRIGFPGPSLESGGYPDFDRPQNGPSDDPTPSS